MNYSLHPGPEQTFESHPEIPDSRRGIWWKLRGVELL